MKIEMRNFFNEESITMIDDFCTYYKNDPDNINTYTNSFRHFSELLNKNDLRLFTFEDYNTLQTTNKSGHAKQLFRYLYAKRIVRARAGEIAQVNRFMPHSTDRKNTGRNIIDQVCGMVRFPRNFR